MRYSKSKHTVYHDKKAYNEIASDAVDITKQEYIEFWLGAGKPTGMQLKTNCYPFEWEDVSIDETAIAAEEAQAYLNSTDWLAGKYTDVVLVFKTMTSAEFLEEYEGEYSQRTVARKVVSDYNDSL